MDKNKRPSIKVLGEEGELPGGDVVEGLSEAMSIALRAVLDIMEAQGWVHADGKVQAVLAIKFDPPDTLERPALVIGICPDYKRVAYHVMAMAEQVMSDTLKENDHFDGIDPEAFRGTG